MKTRILLGLALLALAVPVQARSSQPVNFDVLDSLALEQQFESITQQLVLNPKSNQDPLYDLKEIHDAYSRLEKLYTELLKATEKNNDLSFAVKRAQQEHKEYTPEGAGKRAVRYNDKFHALLQDNKTAMALQYFYLGRMHKILYRDRLLKEIELDLTKAKQLKELDKNIELQKRLTNIRTHLEKLGVFPERRSIEFRMHALQAMPENKVDLIDPGRKWRVSFSFNTRFRPLFKTTNIDWAYYGISYNESMGLTYIHDQKGEPVGASSRLLPPKGQLITDASANMGKGLSLEIERLLGSRLALGSIVEFGQMTNNAKLVQGDMNLSWLSLAVLGRLYVWGYKHVNQYLSLGLAGTTLRQDKTNEVALEGNVIPFPEWTEHYVDEIDTMIFSGLGEFGTVFSPGNSRLLFGFKVLVHYPFASQNLDTQWQYGLNLSAGYSF